MKNLKKASPISWKNFNLLILKAVDFLIKIV